MHDENTVPGDGVQDSPGDDAARNRQRLWAAVIIGAAAIIGGCIVAFSAPAGPAARSRPDLLPTPVLTPPTALKTVHPVAHKPKRKPEPTRTPVQAPSPVPTYAAVPTAAPATHPEQQPTTPPATSVPQQNCYAPPHPTCTPGPPPTSFLRPSWPPHTPYSAP